MNNHKLFIGITTPELLIAHIVTQSVIVFLQCTEVIFFIGVVFGTENNGDNLTVICLLSLTGFAGMLFGESNKTKERELFEITFKTIFKFIVVIVFALLIHKLIHICFRHVNFHIL